MLRIRLILSFLVLSVLFSCNNTNSVSQENKLNSDQKIENPDEKETSQKENKKITIIGVGDIMLGSNYPSKNLLPKNDYNILSHTEKILQGENRGNVFEFARMAVDAGADIIFGQGPHVTRAIELYKNKFISYSAGNFATYGKFNLKGASGIAPIFKITLDSKGNFIEGEVIPVRQTKGTYGPFIDGNKYAVKEIISLNKSDFPEGNGLSVNEDGKIEKK